MNIGAHDKIEFNFNFKLLSFIYFLQYIFSWLIWLFRIFLIVIIIINIIVDWSFRLAPIRMHKFIQYTHVYMYICYSQKYINMIYVHLPSTSLNSVYGFLMSLYIFMYIYKFFVIYFNHLSLIERFINCAKKHYLALTNN